MAVTALCNVFLNETITTGLRFQNSGRCASVGKSHQYSCLIFGAAFRRGLILGGVSGANRASAAVGCGWIDIQNV